MNLLNLWNDTFSSSYIRYQNNLVNVIKNILLNLSQKFSLNTLGNTFHCQSTRTSDRKSLKKAF